VKFGRTTVTIVTLTEDTSNRDRYQNPAIVRTETPVRGCRFRPLNPREDNRDLGDRVTEVHRITAPPHEAILAMTARDEIKVNGTTFRLVGLPRVFDDMSGPFKATIVVERTHS
jgi:hypothetical protein